MEPDPLELENSTPTESVKKNRPETGSLGILDDPQRV